MELEFLKAAEKAKEAKEAESTLVDEKTVSITYKIENTILFIY